MSQESRAATLLYSYELSHAVPRYPELSAAYISRSSNHFKRSEFNQPAQVVNSSKFCENCGSLYIAGFNMSMRVEYGKKKLDKAVKTSEWKGRKRQLSLKCLVCKFDKKFEVLNPQSPVSHKPAISEEQKEKFVAVWEGAENDNKLSNGKNSKSKERSKKRKKNSLSSLLSDKKKKEQQDKQKGILSLDEFMKI